MADWLVNLIIGLASVIFGFISGFFVKTYSIKNSQKKAKTIKTTQKVKGDNNIQQIGDMNNDR